MAPSRSSTARPADASPPPACTVVTTLHGTPAELVGAALTSILHQTFDDLELVVVADGPLDAPQRAVLDELAGDARLHLLEPGRVGRGAALNIGLAAARGRYVAILDADDEAHPRRLELQVAQLEEQPDLAVVGARARRTSDVATHADWTVASAAPARPLDRDLLVRNGMVHSSLTARRSALTSIKGYRADLDRFVDYDLLLRLRAAGHHLAVIDEDLTLKRWHDDQSFDREPRRIRRVLANHRLQFAHARAEPWPHRVLYPAWLLVRLPGRLARSLIRGTR